MHTEHIKVALRKKTKMLTRLKLFKLILHKTYCVSCVGCDPTLQIVQKGKSKVIMNSLMRFKINSQIKKWIWMRWNNNHITVLTVKCRALHF